MRLVSLMVLLLLVGVHPARADRDRSDEIPTAVSPGGVSRVTQTDGRCPTFSWAGVEDADSYELLVYRIEESGEWATVRIRQSLPPSASSWTPSLERCLEHGGRYAWTLSAQKAGARSAWSPPRLFEIAPGPPLLSVASTEPDSSPTLSGGVPSASAAPVSAVEPDDATGSGEAPHTSGPSPTGGATEPVEPSDAGAAVAARAATMGPVFQLGDGGISFPDGSLQTTAAWDENVLLSLRITGSALRPRENDVSWSVGGSGGCLYVTSGDSSTVFNTPVLLPQGSTVDTLRMYYFDTSASNTTAWFTAYDLYGGIAGEWGVSSSGASGFGFNDSAPIGHTVDNDLYSYLLNWRPVAASSTLQLCGFRIIFKR